MELPTTLKAKLVAFAKQMDPDARVDYMGDMVMFHLPNKKTDPKDIEMFFDDGDLERLEKQLDVFLLKDTRSLSILSISDNEHEKKAALVRMKEIVRRKNGSPPGDAK